MGTPQISCRCCSTLHTLLSLQNSTSSPVTTISMSVSVLSSLLCLLMVVSIGDCIRCYQCRSDQRPDCGDPFFPGSVPSTECDNFYTTKTFVCHKTSTFVGIGYITVRGCAPFNKDFFPAQMQQGMAGSYWSGSDVISLCDVNNCNSGRMVQAQGLVSLLLLSLLPVLIKY